MRGPLPFSGVAWWAFRLIPAGAGTTFSRPQPQARHAAHPRRCGDHYIWDHAGETVPGSSPQVRGPRDSLIGSRSLRGLIPAGAGTTLLQNPRPGCPRAHPRRCGDHEAEITRPGAETGSSPQVRGPQDDPNNTTGDTGLIPAGAGTTTQLAPSTTRQTAHPRRCGDHFLSLGLLGGLSGSSPQVRGPRFHALSLKLGTRLIPAGAGTTTSGTMPGRPCQAHPRRCGDHETR